MFLSLLSLVGLALAYANNGELHARDGRAHVHAKREHLQSPLTPPYRPLVWGDFNVIHTTDTHGWLLGHQKPIWPEPNYSGDLGEFASFVTHMRQIAIDNDADLLLVDSGDVHDGTGLTDGFPPGGVNAHESNKFLVRLPYDLMTIGNHELYEYNDTYDMYTNFVPQLRGRYLSSNANITLFTSDGRPVPLPVGDRYVKFRTRKGRRVTSLGVLFDFKAVANTTVQPVCEMVKEQWFKEAIAEEPDVFLLIGHMPVSDDKWPAVHEAIRRVHPHTPIMIFGGHTHIRDCQQYDGRTMAIESGCYMETIGWMSAELDASKGNKKDITFSRRYLDQNRVTYEYHTNKSGSDFDTEDGLSITRGLKQLAAEFNLSHVYGKAPQTYTLNRSQYPASDNVLTLFIKEAAPVALAKNNPRAEIPNIILSNSGVLRYDVFEGCFTKNDQLTAVPYRDLFSYVPNVTLGDAKRVVNALTGGKGLQQFEQAPLARTQETPQVHMSMADAGDLTPGYVTVDGCPDEGDDTRHYALHYYPVPHYINSDPPNVTDDTMIDLVFLDHIRDRVLEKLNRTSAVLTYSQTMAREVLGLYAEAKWN